MLGGTPALSVTNNPPNREICRQRVQQALRQHRHQKKGWVETSDHGNLQYRDILAIAKWPCVALRAHPVNCRSDGAEGERREQRPPRRLVPERRLGDLQLTHLRFSAHIARPMITPPNSCIGCNVDFLILRADSSNPFRLFIYGFDTKIVRKFLTRPELSLGRDKRGEKVRLRGGLSSLRTTARAGPENVGEAPPTATATVRYVRTVPSFRATRLGNPPDAGRRRRRETAA